MQEDLPQPYALSGKRAITSGRNGMHSFLAILAVACAGKNFSDQVIKGVSAKIPGRVV
jgi:hypothetical protein